RVAAACRLAEPLDEDTYTTPASEAVARTAVGAAVDLCEAVLGDSGPQVGFAAVRPPGHHAERGRAMGFCLYSNVALAALEMQARGRARRIAIVDWDVHHGNGTENVLWDRDDLLFVSLHQSPLYPGTGATVDVGEGPGAGWTLNLPMPAGTGDGDFVTLFDEIVIPLLTRVDPDLVIVSAGYDAHCRDPLAGLELTGAGFGWMTQRLRSLQRPVAAVLEGGYDLVGLEEGVAATLDAFAGLYPDGEIPMPSPSAGKLVDRARGVLRPFWGDLEAP
ncbi:MAG: histone deacetylase, partial [Thermoanaerobaculia bacterium]|nr:histone deacetylase [Thermoanaerobaculia bacterium]